VLVDGSLRDYEWYKGYFKKLRHDFPFLRIAILHITAPKEAVLERAAVSISSLEAKKLDLIIINNCKGAYAT